MNMFSEQMMYIPESTTSSDVRSHIWHCFPTEEVHYHFQTEEVLYLSSQLQFDVTALPFPCLY